MPLSYLPIQADKASDPSSEVRRRSPRCGSVDTRDAIEMAYQLSPTRYGKEKDPKDPHTIVLILTPPGPGHHKHKTWARPPVWRDFDLFGNATLAEQV